MRMSKGQWIATVLAGAALLVSGLWYFTQLLEWQKHGSNYMLLVGNVVVTVLLWGILIACIVRSLTDANRAKKVEIAAASRMEELLSLMGKMKQAGGQAALLFCFAEYADDLAKMLEQVWHHWSNAGEKFVCPFGKLEVQGRSAQVLELLDERRDFIVLYSYHVGRLKLEVSDFSSPLLSSDQSDREYAVVLRGLKEHATLLRKAANKVWQSGHTLNSEMSSSKK